MRVAPVPLSVPCTGCKMTSYATSPPSESLPPSVISSVASSATTSCCARATGDWFGGDRSEKGGAVESSPPIRNLTVSVEWAPAGSSTRNCNKYSAATDGAAKVSSARSDGARSSAGAPAGAAASCDHAYRRLASASSTSVAVPMTVTMEPVSADRSSPASATGASLTGVTVMLIVSAADAAPSSSITTN